MRAWELSQIRDLIFEEMDMQDEDFVSPAEFTNFVNEAIDEAEAEIHGLYQDYFLTSAALSLVQGTASYALPSDIYANKIRFIQYKKSSTNFYEVKRLKLSQIVSFDETNSAQDYCYHLENTSASGQRIVIHPTPWETDASSMKLWYYRNAAELSADDDELDIPEFASFIFAYVKVKIARKEGHPALGVYIQELDTQRELMKTTLDRMVPDEDLTIEPDLSFYEEFGSDI